MSDEPTFTPEQSRNWHLVSRQAGSFIHDDWPFNEGWPRTGPQDGATYEILLRDGTLARARIDFSTQYRAEGLRWEVLEGSGIRSPSSAIVFAWKRIS